MLYWHVVCGYELMQHGLQLKCLARVPLSALFDHPSLLKRHLAFKVPISMSAQTVAERAKRQN